MSGAEHPLHRILVEAAAGRPPAPDGSITVVPPLDGPVDAVCSFPAHNVLAIDLPREELLAQLDASDLGAPMNAAFLAWVAGRLSTVPGVVDMVMVAPPQPTVEPAALTERTDLSAHPRVQRASRYRTGLRVFSDPTGSGVLTVGRGLAGRWEMAYEVDPSARGRGLGRSLAAAAPSLVPGGEPLFAQASPGNASSVRSLLAAAYRPIGGECLFERKRD